jgi:AbrB family looped-hinge helix DNA binding protein
MGTQVVRVQGKGQVTIPVEIRDKLNLKKGDLVTFVATEEGVIIKPAEVVVSEALDEIGKALKQRGISLEELMERGREIRESVIREEYELAEIDRLAAEIGARWPEGLAAKEAVAEGRR